MPKQIQAALNCSDPRGLWLIHGDEPLVAVWILDAWRMRWQQNQVERKRVDGKSAKSWLEALSEFDALSLFSSQTAVELHISHKPDKAGLAKLETFASHDAENCLVALMPTQDWRAQKSKLFTLAKRMGTVVNTSINSEQARKALLSTKAEAFELTLSADAWQLLLGQTQNNLLAAYQALWRVSDLVGAQAKTQIAASDTAGNKTTTMVDANTLKPALVSQSRHSVYDLADAVLAGNLVQVVHIINYLKQSKEAPSVVLWTLASDARKIYGLQMNRDIRELGIWSSKQATYKAAARRTPKPVAQNWTEMCLNIDKSIKGASATPAWELIFQLALSMAGKPLLQNTT